MYTLGEEEDSTMRLADIANITLDPEHILRDPWAHDTAHVIVEAKRRALSQSRPAPQRRAKS